MESLTRQLKKALLKSKGPRTSQFHEMCHGLGIQIRYVDRKTCPRSHPRQKIVWVQKDLEASPFLFAGLHEVGHIMTGSDHHTYPYDKMFGGVDARVLSDEAGATKWAIDKSGIPMDPDMFQTAYLSLYSYLIGFRLTYGNPGSRAFVEEALKMEVPIAITHHAPVPPTLEEATTIPGDFINMFRMCKARGAASKLHPDEALPWEPDEFLSKMKEPDPILADS